MKKPVIVAIAIGVLVAAVAGWTGWYLARRSPLPSPSEVKKAHEAAFAYVPARAAFVMTFDVAWYLDAVIDHNFGLLPVVTDPDKVRESLTRASETYLGVDILKATRAVVWAVPNDGAVAVLVEGDFPGKLIAWKDGDDRVQEGVTRHEIEIIRLDWALYGAVTKVGVVFGTEAGVDLAVDVIAGKEEPLSTNTAALERHRKALAEVDDGFFVASADLGEFADVLPKDFKDLQAAALTIGSDASMTAALLGGDSTLALIASQYEEGKKEIARQVDKALADAEKNQSAAAVIALTLVREKLPDVWATGTLEVKGEVMRSESTRVGGVLTGMAAVVAVPAFVKQARRAKTTEAIDQIDKIYKASASYYSTPMVRQGSGERIECQFPRTVEITPTRSCCDPAMDKDGDGRCDVSADLWSSDTWSALNFNMNDQHYFRYAYTSNGLTGTAAKFTASAHADLDCDGVFSTFERYGYGDETATRGECSMKGSAAFFKENETE